MVWKSFKSIHGEAVLRNSFYTLNNYFSVWAYWLDTLWCNMEEKHSCMVLLCSHKQQYTVDLNESQWGVCTLTCHLEWLFTAAAYMLDKTSHVTVFCLSLVCLLLNSTSFLWLHTVTGTKMAQEWWQSCNTNKKKIDIEQKREVDIHPFVLIINLVQMD